MSKCKKYADNIGLAFQIKDDILDVTSTSEVLGKPIGSDAENGKTTFISHMSIDKAQKLVDDLTSEAIEAVSSIDTYGELKELALFLSSRVS